MCAQFEIGVTIGIVRGVECCPCAGAYRVQQIVVSIKHQYSIIANPPKNDRMAHMAMRFALTFWGEGNKTLRAGRRTGLRTAEFEPCSTGLSWAEAGRAKPAPPCNPLPPERLHEQDTCFGSLLGGGANPQHQKTKNAATGHAAPGV